ncbi:MAG: type I-C CRISPR-associated protein Cas5c [Tannerellaceae bacterium]
MEYHNKEYCLEVTGDMACFSRPEMKVERVSYDVITPSAARAVFESIFWKPAIRWQITRIEVLKPIRWMSFRRNEVGNLMSPRASCLFIEENRQQKSSLLLRDVCYRIYAELVFIPIRKRASNEKGDTKLNDENPGKYNAMFERRARNGQCFTQPYLGCREFSANFEYIENPVRGNGILEDCDLGYMLYDMDFTDIKSPKAMFFRAIMKQGVIEIPSIDSEEVRR